MKLSDLSFRNKILVILSLPMLAYLWQSMSQLQSQFAMTVKSAQIEELVQLSIGNSALVHELQKERGNTAGFIGSGGTRFVQELEKQRSVASRTRSQYEQRIADHSTENPQILALNRQILSELAKLDDVRSRVDNMSISTADALGYYTRLNGLLLSVSAITVEVSASAELSAAIIAYYNFLQGKERAGIERAVLSNAFVNDGFAPGMYQRFVTLVAEQDTFFGNFNVLANAANKQLFTQLNASDAARQVNRYRELAHRLSATGGFDTNATDWFEQATLRINALKNTENQVADSLLALCDDIKQAIRASLISNSVAALVMLVIIGFIATTIIRDILHNVRELSNVMSQVREQADLTARVQTHSSDEFGQIANSVNLTLEKIEEAMHQIMTSSESLATAAEESSQTVCSSDALIKAQREEVAMIASSTEELTNTLQQVSTTIQSVASSAQSADDEASKGRNVVQQAYHSIESLAAEIDVLTKTITKLHERSNNITSVVDVIKSVAEQTNLLALNAAIEAARAGEQGRGFAVVADEVRTLAQRTQESTAEIETIITNLQTESNAAFSVIETSQKKAQLSVEESKHVESSLQAITEAINQVSQMSTQIAVTAEQQVGVTRNVAENAVNVESKAMETANGSEHIRQAAEEQSRLAQHLQNVVNMFKIA